MSRAPKVLHIINALPVVGGAERLVVDLCEASSDEAGSRVITWSNTDVSILEDARPEEIDVLPLRPLSFQKVRQAVGWIKAAGVIHAHLFPTIYLVALLPKKKVLTEHNTWNRRRNSKLFRWLDRLVYSRYSALVAISPAVRRSLATWLSIGTDEIDVISNGISISRFLNEQPRTALGEQVRLGMAASFTDQKDQATILRALALLPEKYTVVFAGDGPNLEAMRNLSEELGLGKRVSFLGRTSDMAAYYQSLDIYVQSSFWEGFGLSVVEAMASGLPAIATDVPGLAEVMPNTDLLFPVSDHQALADRLEFLTAEADTYGNHAALSVVRAKEFDIKSSALAYRGLYSRVGSARK
jgi:glycosyltransferase involved in cell wall biosynthesis